MKPGTTGIRLALAAMLLTGLVRAQSPLGFDAPVVVFNNADSSMIELLDFNGDGSKDSLNVKIDGTYLYLSLRNLPGGQAWYQDLIPVALSFAPATAVGTVGPADGRDDFAVGFNQSVRVYVGAPIGPYSVNTVFAEPATVRGVAIGDFNGDGLGDVAVLTATELRVHEYMSPGSYGMATYAVSAGPTSQLVAGDANADGVADLVVVDAACSIFTMTANALVPGQTYVHGISGPMPTMGDIDGDGDDDIVVFGMTHYVVLRQTAPGAFTVEPVTLGGPATHLYDIDGDGDLDGACCGGGGSGPPLYLNNPSIFRVSVNQGGGSFAPAFELPGIGSIHLAGVADLNGDGIKDLAAGRCIYFASAPLSQDPDLPGPGLPIGPRSIADLDQDGDPDWTIGLGAVAWNTGDGHSQSGVPILLTPPPTGTTYTAPGFPGDWDGDGDVDLLVEQMAGPTTFLGMVLLKNDGGAFSSAGPAFPPSIQFSTWIGNDPERTIAADVDGDGDLDIVGNSPGPAAWSVVSLNAGNGTFFPTEAYPFEVIIAVADFTGDGYPDYLTSDGRIMFRRGLAGGGHGPTEQLAPPGASAFLAYWSYNPFTDRIAVADFNGDGRLDFAGCDRSAGYATTMLMLGNPPGSQYAFTTTSSSGGLNVVGTVYGCRAFAGDVDGDGLPDLVVSDPTNVSTGGVGVAFSRAGLPQIFDSTLTRVQVAWTYALADVDGDGDSDIIGPRIVRARGWEGSGAGARVQYGTGIGGAGGVVPTLGETGPFRSGKSCEVRFRGGVGGASGAFAFGLAPANTPLFGGTLLVTPDVIVPVQLGGAAGVPGAGSLTLPFVMPASLVGATIFHQAGFTDAAAPSGISATNGLSIHVGS